MRQAGNVPFEFGVELGGEAQAYVGAIQVSAGIHVGGPVLTYLFDPLHLMPTCIAQVIREA